jgi:hypothetical protein
MSIQIIGEVKNPDSIKKYGSFQKVYKKEDGVDAVTVARNMLKGLERKGTIQALGDVTCLTGYSVAIRDEYTGMWGIFHINSDSHTWQDGVHKMTLDISFDAIMDETTYRTQKAKKGKSSGTVLEWNL